MVLGRDARHRRENNTQGMPEFWNTKMAERLAVKQEHLREDGEGFQVRRCSRKETSPFPPPLTWHASLAQDLEGIQAVHLGPGDRTEELIYIMCLESWLAQSECYVNVGLSVCCCYAIVIVPK